jgi:uncharacterized protein YyaL (SSP411 family)
MVKRGDINVALRTGSLNKENKMQAAWTKPMELAVTWLVNTDVRQLADAHKGFGGVKQGYNWETQSYPYVYSEITGYAVSCFVNMYRWSGETRYLDLARQSAQFLLDIQDKTDRVAFRGAIPQGLSLPELDVMPQYHSFDAAMCLQGLLDLNAIEQTPVLRMTSQSIGDWLVTQMQQESGAFLSMHNALTGEITHNTGQVFDDGSCLHAKHAIGLLKLGHLTGDDRYTKAARRVCDWVLNLQDKDGALWTTEAHEKVVSHSHCYATEGLLYSYEVLKDTRYLEAAHRAGLFLLQAQNQDGSINIDYKQTWWRMGRRIAEKVFPRRVSDATAQAIRIWLALYYLQSNPRFLKASFQAQKYLQRVQVSTSNDPNASGGFPYWPGHPMMYTWCAMFAIHAFYALENSNRQNGYQCLITELF